MRVVTRRRGPRPPAGEDEVPETDAVGEGLEECSETPGSGLPSRSRSPGSQGCSRKGRWERGRGGGVGTGRQLDGRGGRVQIQAPVGGGRRPSPTVGTLWETGVGVGQSRDGPTRSGSIILSPEGSPSTRVDPNGSPGIGTVARTRSADGPAPWTSEGVLLHTSGREPPERVPGRTRGWSPETGRVLRLGPGRDGLVLVGRRIEVRVTEHSPDLTPSRPPSPVTVPPGEYGPS